MASSEKIFQAAINMTTVLETLENLSFTIEKADDEIFDNDAKIASIGQEIINLEFDATLVNNQVGAIVAEILNKVAAQKQWVCQYHCFTLWNNGGIGHVKITNNGPDVKVRVTNIVDNKHLGAPDNQQVTKSEAFIPRYGHNTFMSPARYSNLNQQIHIVAICKYGVPNITIEADVPNPPWNGQGAYDVYG